MKRRFLTSGVVAFLGAWLAGSQPAPAQTLVKSICRVKGQEENTLRGLGLVVGLNKTGDGGQYAPMIRSLAMALQLMGNPVAVGAGKGSELKDTKNAALVWVSATVPAAGARQGDMVDCEVVSCGNAKSLEGGRLLSAAMMGPRTDSTRIYGFSQGNIYLDAKETPLRGRIKKGCRLEEDFFTKFSQDGKVTLILDQHHRDFQVAQNIAARINIQLRFESGGSFKAQAIDAANIVANIPTQYRDDPVVFLSQVMGVPIPPEDLRTESRVVINKSAKSIVISGDVEIGAVIVTHKNVTVDTGAGAFITVDPEERYRQQRQGQGLVEDGTLERNAAAKLSSLEAALNAIQVPPEDRIVIIEQINQLGKLHGKLIVE